MIRREKEKNRIVASQKEMTEAISYALRLMALGSEARNGIYQQIEKAEKQSKK